MYKMNIVWVLLIITLMVGILCLQGYVIKDNHLECKELCNSKGLKLSQSGSKSCLCLEMKDDEIIKEREFLR